MPTISVPQLKKLLEVPVATNLMKALRDAGLPVASSCLGDGVCAKCRMKVSPAEGVTAADDKARDTEKFLLQKFKLQSPIRISCQVEVQSDITVETTYW